MSSRPDDGATGGNDRASARNPVFPKRLAAAVGEVGLRKHRPCLPTLETFGVHTVSVSREDPSLHVH
jgi:hypothetical protein